MQTSRTKEPIPNIDVQLSPSLRKAAVLISALDEPTAERILQQMGADDAAKVRSALVELDDIPAEEQQQVLAEFLQQQEARRHCSRLRTRTTFLWSSIRPSKRQPRAVSQR